MTLYPFMIHALFMSLFASIIGPFGGFFASGESLILNEFGLPIKKEKNWVFSLSLSNQTPTFLLKAMILFFARLLAAFLEFGFVIE